MIQSSNETKESISQGSLPSRGLIPISTGMLAVLTAVATGRRGNVLEELEISYFVLAVHILDKKQDGRLN